MTGSFTELRIYQIAHKLALGLYKLTKSFPKEEKYGLTDQLRRAGVSVVSNIAEGHGRYHTNDIVKFLIGSRASIFEIQSQLAIARDLEYCSTKDTASLNDSYSELAKQINSFILYKRSFKSKKKNLRF